MAQNRPSSNALRFIFTAGLVGLGIWAYSRAKTIGTLLFYPGPISGIKWKDGAPFITIKIAVQNTTSNKITLYSIAGNVFYQNTLIGNASFFSPQVIPPNTGGYITLDLKMSILGIVNEIINAISSGVFNGVLQMDGYANVDGVQLPLGMSFKIGA